MGADEADMHHAVGVVDPDHQPVFIACQIKHRAPVLQDAGRAKVALDSRRRRPVGMQCVAIPGRRGFLGILMVRLRGLISLSNVQNKVGL